MLLEGLMSSEQGVCGQCAGDGFILCKTCDGSGRRAGIECFFCTDGQRLCPGCLGCGLPNRQDWVELHDALVAIDPGPRYIVMGRKGAYQVLALNIDHSTHWEWAGTEQQILDALRAKQ